MSSGFKVRYATQDDKSFWVALDKHISASEFDIKVRDKRCYIISDGDTPIGVMRYNLFWDSIPFLTLIELDGSHHRRGFGTQAILFWEAEMHDLGYAMVMTSTRVDEDAQHFYRQLGYVERGSIFLDGTPLSQPQEMFMLKVL